MPIAPANDAGIELAYETFGDPSDVPILFVMGLGAQLLAWDVDLLESFVDRGFFAIRFDNRDVGLSTKADVGDLDVGAQIMGVLTGQDPNAPYLLRDMAADAVSLLDHLGIAATHLVGASMGGMIAQTIAIEHPERVLSLTSIMSTTGESHVGQPDPSVLPVLLTPPADDRAAAVEAGVAASRAISGPANFDEDRARERAEQAYDRSFYPAGVGHHLLAILASGSRAEGLQQLNVPTLVVHGDVDPLVTVSGGRRTAELIPGAEYLEIETMGHDTPPLFFPQIVEAVTALAGRVAA